MLKRLLLALLLLAGLDAAQAAAQEASGSKALAAVSPEQLMKIPAKKLFGSIKGPTTSMAARSSSGSSR